MCIFHQSFFVKRESPVRIDGKRKEGLFWQKEGTKHRPQVTQLDIREFIGIYDILVRQKLTSPVSTYKSKKKIKNFQLNGRGSKFRSSLFCKLT